MTITDLITTLMFASLLTFLILILSINDNGGSTREWALRTCLGKVREEEWEAVHEDTHLPDANAWDHPG